MKFNIQSSSVGLLLASILISGCATDTRDRTNAGTDASRGSSAARRPAGAPAPIKKPLVVAQETEEAIQAGLPESNADKNSMVAHFIDVGQGDATLLEFSCGAVLIDTGGETSASVNGGSNLVEYLKEFFNRRSDLGFTLNLVVLSHPHIDHTDGVMALLDMEPAITIQNIVDDAMDAPKASGMKGQKALQKYASDNGQHYFGVKEKGIATVDGLTNNIIDPIDCRSSGGIDPKITALWGGLKNDGVWTADENNNSVVLRVEFGDSSFLFTGDLEDPGIRAMVAAYEDDLSMFDVDVLKVGHHGSKNATTAPFVKAVSPKIALIGVGDPALSHEQYSTYNYGHPNIAAINMLLDSASGVSSVRKKPKKVTVGVSGVNRKEHKPPVFTSMTMRKAIYATGWDGNIAVTANKDGTLSVEMGF